MRPTIQTLALSLSLALGLSASLATSVKADGHTSTTADGMTPVENVMAETEAVTETGAEATSTTIVDIAAGDEIFSTLVTAVTEAGLVDTLSGEGPFTVFAPTNDAFAALPPGALEALLLPANQAVLTQILTYHVVSGSLTSADLEDGAVPSVEGGDIIVSLGESVKVNNATVIQADIEASNGVIHVIDTVIIPPSLLSALSTNEAAL